MKTKIYAKLNTHDFIFEVTDNCGAFVNLKLSGDNGNIELLKVRKENITYVSENKIDNKQNLKQIFN